MQLLYILYNYHISIPTLKIYLVTLKNVDNLEFGVCVYGGVSKGVQIVAVGLFPILHSLFQASDKQLVFHIPTRYMPKSMMCWNLLSSYPTHPVGG